MRANLYFKKVSDKIVIPIAKVLVKLKVSPDLITVIGVVATSLVSVIFIAQGEWLIGSILLFFVTALDLLDGAMARLMQRESVWGAFLDSVMDRISDGVILGSLIYYFYSIQNTTLMVLTIWALVMSEVTSYTRARAESVGLEAKVGIAERPERLAFVVWGTFLTALGLSWMSAVMIWGLALVSTITVGQRISHVRRQVKNLS
jgi:CDP-diacylglycerol--glycerol-3-phosphate 3-phosphatidyltransferase/CDP-diacylglycerol--inositol 3-phosphatidyltransferase